jgi:hypothetical protein
MLWNPPAVPLTNGTNTSRVVPLITMLVTVVSHTLIAAICTYLPQDFVRTRYGLIGYAVAGYAASALGVYGIITVSVPASPSTRVLASDPQNQQDQRFTSLFQHFQLLGVFLLSCAPLVVLELFFSTTHNLGTCPSMISAALTDQTHLSRKADINSENQLELLEAGSWCWYVLRMIHILSVCVLVCTCAVLGILAVAVGNYVRQTRSNPEQGLSIDFERYHEALDGKKQRTGDELVALVGARC